MRNSKYLLAVITGFVSLASASAQAVPIDFQTLSDGVTTPTFLSGGSLPDHTPFLVGAEYSSSGVVFSSDGETDPELGPIFGDLTGFAGPGNIIVQDYKRSLPEGTTFNVRADFIATTDFVSVDAYTAAGESVTMSAFNAGGDLLGSVTSAVIASFGDSEFISLSGIGDIAYVIWESSSPFAAAVGIDNLDFAEVPLPGALPLIISGLAGLGFASRRRKT